MDFKSNKPNQPGQPNQPAPAVIEQPQVDTAVQNAVNWLGKQLRSIREWTGKDGRQYASISHSNSNPGNGTHNSPLDVADELLALKKNTREFVTFDLRYNNKTAHARLISVDRVNDKLVFALDVEYNVGGAQGSITAFAPKKNVEAVAEQPDLGFGKLV